MSDRQNKDLDAGQAYLPDFCAPTTVFVIVVVAELVAIVLTIAAWQEARSFLIDLSKNSLFILWTALLGCALMCQFKSRFERFGSTAAFVWAYITLVLMTLALAEIAFQLTRIFGQSVIIEDSHAGFLVRSVSISAIVTLLLMRYLYVASEWRRSVVLEAQARISALQALIRPHFLFNSMNTIASLTRSNPRLAEQAVEDLADLLRASLSTSQDMSTLREEFEVASIYERIEKLRLGERLEVRWDVDALPEQARIPSLTLQPLVENAIHHGIEQLADGGTVWVVGDRHAGRLRIRISNPTAPNLPGRTGGHKMALSNIRQRFELAYGRHASVDIDEAENRFTVTLLFPDGSTV